MIGIIVFCHGTMAQGMKHAAEMIVGPQPDLTAIGIEPGQGRQQVSDLFDAAIADTDTGNGVLVMTDLVGGTPCNTTALKMGEGIEMLAGFSLPSLIKALMSRSEVSNPRELAELVSKYGRKHMTTGTEMLRACDRVEPDHD